MFKLLDSDISIVDMNKHLSKYGVQYIDQKDIDSMKTVLKGEFLTTGPFVRNFERLFSKEVKSKFALSCSNGTAALHLSLKALGIGKNDMVIVPTITFVATLNAILMSGAIPILSDVNESTGLIEEKNIIEILNNIPPGTKIKAIIVVHLNGNIVDVSKIKKLFKKIRIIEDSCHAIGSFKRVGKKIIRIGSCYNSDLATFSFHPVKTITTGEGGMVTTNEKSVFEKLKLLRSHHIESLPINDKNYPYRINNLGYNYRLSDINCALGISQLKKLKKFKEHRKQLVKFYNEKFSQFENHITPVSKSQHDICWHLYVILVNYKHLKVNRSQLMNSLKLSGIGTQIHYKPLHRNLHLIKQLKEYYYSGFSGAMKYYNGILTLPLHYNMDLNDANYVVSSVLKKLQLNNNKK